jgi:YVTN family beta-propeller protein
VVLAALTLAACTARAVEPAAGAAAKVPVSPEAYDRLRVGDSDGQRIVVPTNQVLSPLGEQVAFPDRPTALAVSPHGRWLAVLSHDQVLTIDLDSRQIVGRAAHDGGSYTGILFSGGGEKLFASNTHGTIGVFTVQPDGGLKAESPIKIPTSLTGKSASALPAGLTFGAEGKNLWAALNLHNTVAEIDLAAGRVLWEIPVGNAPYEVVRVGGKLYVSNWAGRLPQPGQPTGPSGRGVPVRVDPRRHIASDGSVSVVEWAGGREVKQIAVGLHPCGLAASPDGRFVCVANANSDTVSVIDTGRDEVVETISVRPAEKLLFGSAPNALSFSHDGRLLYVALGGNNAVALVDFTPPHSRLRGCLPTGWYPGGLALDPLRHALYVANVKGVGSREAKGGGKRQVKGKAAFGYNSLEYLGTVSLIPLPKDDELPRLTQTVLANNRLTEAVSALAPPRPDAPPQPVPARHGEPSVMRHVLYIIKENRTFDQVFGDLPQGNGDPQLCIFGRDVTPNQHKLAEEFVLLDNFYCSGALSADGHQWTDEAYVTDYIEKGFGGWPRSYPYDGNDALAYASSGFLWDNALARGRTLRVYGEFTKATVRWKDRARSATPTFLDCYRDFLAQSGQIEIRATANIKTLEPYICPTAIGFPGIVPDVYRAEQFIRELKEAESRGTLPDLMVMLLPNDHTSGTRPGRPTPEAAVADNDLAVGRIVEALSRSKFWPQTCIFIVEDDPQNGFDHIDGHRTVAMVLSPYTRRRGVDSTNYNQTSMVRTIELILGLPPMNQFDASATPMTSCFARQPELTPYQAVPNQIPLDRLNPELSRITNPRQRAWAEVSLRLPLDEVDQADEDTFNRILWHARRGRDDTYPAWASTAEPVSR